MISNRYDARSLHITCHFQIYRMSQISVKLKYDVIDRVGIKSMKLLKQYFNNEIAIWTFLTDDIEHYSIGAIKLLKSLKKNAINTNFDAFVLELVNKPIPSLIKANLELTDDKTKDQIFSVNINNTIEQTQEIISNNFLEINTQCNIAR